MSNMPNKKNEVKEMNEINAEIGDKAAQRSTGHGSSSRGFAAMNEELRKEIASRGGKAAHQKGTAHEFTSEEARLAGQKGGEARQSR